MKKDEKKKFVSEVLRPRNDEKEYSEHLRRRMHLEYLNKMLRRPQDWMPRLALEEPGSKPEDHYKALKEEQHRLLEEERKYEEKQRLKQHKTKNPFFVPRFAGISRLEEIPLYYYQDWGVPRPPPRPTLTTVLTEAALPNGFLNHYILAPRRGIEVNDWVPLQDESMLTFHVKLDYQHLDAMDIIGALTWDFPPREARSMVNWEARLKRTCGSGIIAHFGYVRVSCVYFQKVPAETPRIRDYSEIPSSFMEHEGSTSASEETYYLAGSFSVPAGEVSRLGIGCRVRIVVESGFAETVDGELEFRAQLGDNWFDTVPGVKYSVSEWI